MLPPDRSRRAESLVVVLIILAAVLLRALSLTTAVPFEQDERYTVIESSLLFDSPLVPGISARPLYFLLQHALFVVMADSPLGLRSMPFVFGILGVAVTWYAGRRLFGPLAGAVAAFLVAVCPWHLYASGFARYYSLVYLLSVATFVMLVRSYESDQRSDYSLALLWLTLGTITHPSFLFPMPGFALGLSLVRQDGRLGWRWPTAVSWRWLWGPFCCVLLAGFAALRLSGANNALKNFGGRGTDATLRLVPAMVEWMTPTIFAVGGLGVLVLSIAATQPSRRRWGVGALVGGLGALAVLIYESSVTNVYADYGVSALPLLIVAAGALVQLASERSSVRPWVLGSVAAAALSAGVIPSTISHLSDGTRFDYRPAFARIRAAGTSRFVLTWPIVLQRYYGTTLHAGELIADRPFLDSTLDRERDIWAVVSVRRFGIVPDSGGVIAAWLSDACRLVSAFERPRLDYRRYRVELYRCTSGAGRP